MTDCGHECEWVRARLPLLTADGEEQEEPDRGDLASDERLRLEQHLALCSACRHERATLQSAMEALAAAGRYRRGMVESLWPSLEKRIEQARDEAQSRRGRKKLPRLARAIESFREEAPLRRQWNRDSLKATGDRLRSRPRAVLALTSIAAVLVVLVGWSVLSSRPAQPAPGNDVPPVLTTEPSSPLADLVADEPIESASDEALADRDADSSHTRSQVLGSGAGIAHAAPPPSRSPRRAADQESGVIQTPDAHEPKPVY